MTTHGFSPNLYGIRARSHFSDFFFHCMMVGSSSTLPTKPTLVIISTWIGNIVSVRRPVAPSFGDVSENSCSVPKPVSAKLVAILHAFQ